MNYQCYKCNAVFEYTESAHWFKFKQGKATVFDPVCVNCTEDKPT